MAAKDTSNTSKCKHCGADIAWAQNRHGKWYPQSVKWSLTHKKTTGKDYYVPVAIPGWHTCEKTADQKLAQAESTLKELREKLASVDTSQWYAQAAVTGLLESIRHQEAIIADIVGR